MNTLDLTPSEYQDYVRKMIELHILIRDKHDKLKISPLVEKGISSQKEQGIDEIVKDELGPNDIESEGVFLSGIILLGMCLVPFGIKGNDLFHCLNIILISLDFTPINQINSKAVLGWINLLFPDIENKENDGI